MGSMMEQTAVASVDAFEIALNRPQALICRRGGRRLKASMTREIMLFNLRSDPFERSQHEAGDYVKWFVEHAFVLLPAQTIVAQHLASYQAFPPRQRPGSFSIEQVMQKLRNPPSSNQVRPAQNGSAPGARSFGH